MAKILKLAITNNGRVWNKWNNLPTMLVAIIIITELLWKTLLLLLRKLNTYLPYDPAISLLGTHLWELRAVFTKDLQNMLRSFIYNSKKWGTTQMPINNKLEKQFRVYSYDRTPHNKRGLIHTTWRNLTNSMLKKPTKKRVYDSIYIEFRNKHNLLL